MNKDNDLTSTGQGAPVCLRVMGARSRRRRAVGAVGGKFEFWATDAQKGLPIIDLCFWVG